jgi:endonuclease III
MTIDINALIARLAYLATSTNEEQMRHVDFCDIAAGADALKQQQADNAMHEQVWQGMFNAAIDRAEKAEADIDRAFQMLAVYGVSRERARHVANGIDVLMQRMNKEHAALEAEIMRLQDPHTYYHCPSCNQPQPMSQIIAAINAIEK